MFCIIFMVFLLKTNLRLVKMLHFSDFMVQKVHQNCVQLPNVVYNVPSSMVTQTLPVLPACRARSAEDLQEEAISDQLALLERLQPAAGRHAPVPHFARPRSGTAVRAAAELHLLPRPGPAQASHGEHGSLVGSGTSLGSQEDFVFRGSEIYLLEREFCYCSSYLAASDHWFKLWIGVWRSETQNLLK